MYELLSNSGSGFVPVTPPVYKKTALTGTKDITKAEFDIDIEDELMYLVYFPSMLDPAEEKAKQMLSTIPVDWKVQSNVIFASLCLSYVPGQVLPQAIFSEGDVVAWCESTILRPALAVFRACQTHPVVAQLAQHPRHPSIASAASKQVIPDRVLLQDVEYLDWDVAREQERAENEELRLASQKRDEARESVGYPMLKRTFPENKMSQTADEASTKIAKPVPILTVELKTSHVWSRKLFKDIFLMPHSDDRRTHAMRFAWPLVWHEPNKKTSKAKTRKPDETEEESKQTRVKSQPAKPKRRRTESTIVNKEGVDADKETKVFVQVRILRPSLCGLPTHPTNRRCGVRWFIRR